MQASEGNVIEASGSKRRQLAGRLFGNLFEDQDMSDKENDQNIEIEHDTISPKPAQDKVVDSISFMSDCEREEEDFLF